MATTPTSTTFIFVDRRKTGRGKSVNNRQKLLRRIKESIKLSRPEDIDAGGVKKSGAGSSANTYTNQIKVAKNALAEPTFSYSQDQGVREVILIGNDQWLKGDEFPIQREGSGGGGSGPGEDGEDDFIVNISRSEFFDVFFEDCELPNLKENSKKELPEAVWKPAGFQKDGNPGQLSVIRSFKISKGRRLALTSGSRAELEALTRELDQLLLEEESDVEGWAARMQEVTLRISELKAKLSKMSMFEDVDLRYRRRDRVHVKASEAVLCMIMDISGSMDEDKKRIARKFFSLQFAFIKRKYEGTDLIFIAHTDEAEEMDEEVFFTTTKSGGTIVSPSWKLAHETINSRYDSDQTNIYISYAGDGDNWESDNADVIEEIEGTGLLSKIRHAVYVQVGQSFAAGYGGGITLWNVMKSIANSNKKFDAIKIDNEEEVFDQFKQVYGKKRNKK